MSIVILLILKTISTAPSIVNHNHIILLLPTTEYLSEMYCTVPVWSVRGHFEFSSTNWVLHWDLLWDWKLAKATYNKNKVYYMTYCRWCFKILLHHLQYAKKIVEWNIHCVSGVFLIAPFLVCCSRQIATLLCVAICRLSLLQYYRSGN